MKPTIQFVFIFLLSFTVTSVCAQTEWKLEKSDDGINVYTRVLPNIDFKEFKADITIQAPMSDLIHALNDISEHTNWMEDVDQAEIIQKDPEILIYQISVPFPFKNRYAVMSTKIIEGEGTYRMEMQDTETTADLPKKLVPISHVSGYWQFTKVEDNITDVVYQFVSDPGGSIPDWLVNSFVVQSPYHTLENLRERLE